RWSSVDLPAPEGPITDTKSPGFTSRLMRRSTWKRPAPWSNVFSMPRSRTSGSACGSRGGVLAECAVGVVLMALSFSRVPPSSAAEAFEGLLRVGELGIQLHRRVDPGHRLA